MNENEAKTKWCPMFRQSSLSDDGNRNYGNPFNENDRCIASECMAWRWYYSIANDLALGTSPHKTDGDGNELGYCGLAGRDFG